VSLIQIDGSQGEGGGQVLRTALALSLITGRPFRIENIRARREKPGLLRQHLTAVKAAADVGEAAVDGVDVGASSMTFVPKTLRGGNLSFSIGTAGSTTLVLQTILVPLLLSGERATVEIEGGTHNPAAPPFDFLDQAYLPLLRRMGAKASIELVKPGFYPAGGGKVRIEIDGTGTLGPLELVERGEIIRRRVRAVVANLPYSIAEREAKTAGIELAWTEDCLEAHTLTGSVGPGNAISIFVTSENVTEVFTAFGAKRLRAEEVAHDAAKQARRYINSGSAVGEHLADQLLLPLAAGGGGAFTTLPLSSHSMTNIDVVKKFVQADFELTQLSNGKVQVGVARSG
jgi:RNA 3'-terminal phosphate cyclase (ATP)